MHCLPPSPAAQRKGVVLRRGKPTVVPQRQPNGHDSALKGYALPSDGSLHAAQPPAQHGHGERAQQTQRRFGARPQSAATTGHAADGSPAVSPVHLEGAGAAEQRAAEGPSNGRCALQNGASGDATQRLAGKKRKLVGDAQQAGIVSGILAQREPAKRDSSAGAQSGMPFGAPCPAAWLAQHRCCDLSVRAAFRIHWMLTLYVTQMMIWTLPAGKARTTSWPRWRRWRGETARSRPAFPTRPPVLPLNLMETRRRIRMTRRGFTPHQPVPFPLHRVSDVHAVRIAGQ